MSISPPLQPPPPPPESSSSIARLIRTTLSYDTNVMLAAIISLLLVILFVLLLHLYTRWFLLQARRRSRTSVNVPHVLGSRLHQRFTIIDTSNSDDNSNAKFGLPIAIISSLPLFVYNFSSIGDRNHGLECAICLCVFEDEEIGRKLPACGHAFHVECIDMWLQSHSTCPICRATIQYNQSRKIDNNSDAEFVDSGLDLNILTVNNEEDLRLEIVTTSSDHNQILEARESDVATVNECGSSSSSSTGELELAKILLTISGRSESKVYPSSNVNGDDSVA
ncbi:RING-H2 finger protein ATL2-like [Bidens hawaiensis]|uniref:RING-H2 finger protein ATL2-like n=1 Tax=Bidens hawaiensis TaxID=980011 RepID=UPI00404957F0